MDSGGVLGAASRWGIAVALSALLAAPAAAGTIEVQGAGSSEAAVAAFRFEFRLVEEKTSAVEAARDFAANRARVDKAFAELAVAGLVVSGGGVEVEFFDRSNDPFVGVQVINGRRVQPEVERLVRFAERITVRIPVDPSAAPGALLERIAQVLDVADEVGLDPAVAAAAPGVWVQPQLAEGASQKVFSVEVADPEAVRHAAEGAALAEARRRAERLAEAAGLAIGEVQTIRATRTGLLAPAGGSLLLARQEVELTVLFSTR